jgi:hypothetical protein
MVKRFGGGHDALDFLNGDQVIVDHLLKLLLDEAQIMLLLLVLVLDQQEVEGEDLVEELGECEEVRDIGQHLVLGQLHQLHSRVHHSQVDCVGRLLAGLELVQQSQLLYLQEGQVEGEQVGVDLHHLLVKLQVFLSGLVRSQSFDGVEVGQ